MLYSVPIKLDKEYYIKIGTLEVSKLQDQNIDWNRRSIKDSFSILCIALKELDPATNKLTNVKMLTNEFMALWDESEYNMDDLLDIVEEAINRGLYKGREQKKREPKTE